MRNCSIPNHIYKLNISQEEKERLSDIEYDVWKELADSKLFTTKKGIPMMPKVNYGKALGKIAEINKKTPIIRLSKQSIGEVIQVDASKLATLNNQQSNNERKNLLAGMEFSEFVSYENSSRNETTLNSNQRKRIFEIGKRVVSTRGDIGQFDISDLWEGVQELANDTSETSSHNSDNTRTGKENLSQLFNNTELTRLDRYSGLLESIVKRLSDDSFNGKLFRYIREGLGGVEVRLVNNGNFMYVHDKGLYVNMNSLIDFFETTNVERERYLDRILSEELIHFVTNSYLSELDIEILYQELINRSEIFNRLTGIYNFPDIEDKYVVTSEYLRMLIQQEFFGETTEISAFNFTESAYKFIREAWDFIVNFLKQEYPEHTKNMVVKGVDIINKAFLYQEELTTKQTEITPELKSTLEGFCKKLNPDFKIEVLDNLVARMGVYGIAKFNEFVIQLQEGKEGELPEEVAHFFVEMLPTDHPLLEKMYDEITRTRIYKDVVTSPEYQRLYKGDTVRIKKEAMGKLIALYLTDKEGFKKMSGSDSLIENLIRWIKDFFKWIKGQSTISSFVIAANDILDLDTSKLTGIASYDEMYSVASVNDWYQSQLEIDKTNFRSLNGVDISKYEKIFVNIDETIFSNLKPKDLGRPEDFDKFIATANLTPFGRELKDKIKFNRDKFVFFTDLPNTIVLKDKMKIEFGTKYSQIQSKETSEELVGEHGTMYMVVQNIQPQLTENTLLISDARIETLGKKCTVPKKSTYVPLAIQWEQMRQKKERIEISQAYLDEFKKLGIDTFAGEITNTFYLINQEVRNNRIFTKKIEELNDEELRNVLVGRGTGLPIQMSTEQKISAVKKQIQLFQRDVMNFVSTLESLNAYYTETLNNGFEHIETLKNSGDKKALLAAIWEVNKIVTNAQHWKSHIKEILVKLPQGTTKTKELYSNLLGTIEQLEAKAISVSAPLIAQRLVPAMTEYNANRTAAITEIDKQIAEHPEGSTKRQILEEKKALLSQQITTETIKTLLEGGKDLAKITVWLKTLFNSSNPLVAGIDLILKGDAFDTQNDTIQQTLDIDKKRADIEKDFGLTKEDTKILVIEDNDLVYDEKAKKHIPKPRLTILNPFKNRYIKDEKQIAVNELRKDWEKDKDNEEKKTAFYTAKKDFEKWLRDNYHDEFTEEFQQKYDSLKDEYGDLFEEAVELNRSYYIKLRELQDNLKIAESLEDQAEIKREILEVKADQRRLKTPFNSDGSKKEEHGQKIAEILKKKTETDKEYYEYKTDEEKFKSDALAFIAGQSLTPVQEFQFKTFIASGKNASALAYAKEIGNEPIEEWFDLNTNIKYSDDFYTKRKSIVEEIQGILGSKVDLTKLWEDVTTLSSPYRDEDGFLNGDIAPIEVQQKVTEFEHEIERIKQIPDEDNVLNKKQKERLSELFDSLKELQSKETTESYGEVFYERATDISNGTSFKDTFSEEFGYSTDLNGLINSPQFKTWIDNHPTHPFTIWYVANHVATNRKIFDEGTFETYVETVINPSYLWRKTIPNDENHILAVPSFKYSTREVKDNYKTEKIPFVTYLESTDEWLPKADSPYMSDEYKALQRRNDRKAEGLRKLLILARDSHFDTQDTFLYDAQIGWFLASIQTHDWDSSSVQGVYNDIVDKLNRYEEGEGNAEEVSFKEKLKEKLSGIFQQGLFSTIEQSDPRGKVPVPYAYWANPKDVTRDLFGSILMYRGSTAIANKMFDNLPAVNLVLKVLEESPNPQKNTIGAVDFLRKNRLYGHNKNYEIGKGWDRGFTMARKLSSFGLLSDLTGISNNIKNRLAGAVQNVINTEFGNWASTKAYRQAASHKKNNFLWFLSQADKQQTKPDKDFFIQAFFNPTIHGKLAKLILPGATGRFLKSEPLNYAGHIFEYSLACTTLYGHLFSKKVYRMVGETKEEKTLYDVLSHKDNKLHVEEGWKDSRNNRDINEDYLKDLRIKYSSVLEYTHGKIDSKTLLSITTIGQALLFWKNWFVPMLRRRFDKKQANFAIGEDLEGYWLTFGKFLKNSFLAKENLWSTLSKEEQGNVWAAAKEMGAIMAFGTLVFLVFGFDYDDPDKFKKLKQHGYLYNMSLLLALQVQTETETLSPFGIGNVGNQHIVGAPPIFMEGYRFIEKPWMGLGAIKNTIKVFDNIIGFPQYDKDLPAYNIHEGEYKSWHYAKKIWQWDDFVYTTQNPEGKLQVMLNLLKQ